MKMSNAAQADLARLIRNRKFERTEMGVFVPPAKLFLGGIFSHAINGEDWQHTPNIVVNEGLDHILDVALSGATVSASFFVGLAGSSGWTPAAGDTGSNIASNSGEVTTEYDETDRQTWVEAGVSSQSITNSASTADFTFNTGDTVYGAFLVGGAVGVADTKGGTGGILIAGSTFSASRAVVALDVLSVTYTLTAADA
jgi:hypothetical protein